MGDVLKLETSLLRKIATNTFYYLEFFGRVFYRSIFRHDFPKWVLRNSFLIIRRNIFLSQYTKIIKSRIKIEIICRLFEMLLLLLNIVIIKEAYRSVVILLAGHFNSYLKSSF